MIRSQTYGSSNQPKHKTEILLVKCPILCYSSLTIFSMFLTSVRAFEKAGVKTIAPLATGRTAKPW